jgi:hypothetical protein
VGFIRKAPLNSSVGPVNAAAHQRAGVIAAAREVFLGYQVHAVPAQP